MAACVLKVFVQKVDTIYQMSIQAFKYKSLLEKSHKTLYKP